MTKFIRLNTVFVPPSLVMQEAIKWSKKISEKYRSVFVLDGQKMFPHITIYATEYPVDNIPVISDAIEKIAGETSKVEFIFDRIEVGNNTITFKFKDKDDITKIHQRAVQELNPLREGRIREKYQKRLKEGYGYTDQQKDNIQKYGCHRVLDLYHPHMSLVRLEKEGSAAMATPTVSWPISSFTVDLIGLYEMGEHGTCTKCLKTFDLK